MPDMGAERDLGDLVTDGVWRIKTEESKAIQKLQAGVTARTETPLQKPRIQGEALVQHRSSLLSFSSFV